MTLLDLFFVLLVTAVGSYFGSYLRSSATQKAIKENIKEITDKQESVIHKYLEERETLKIKREKIEAAYDGIQEDTEVLLANISHTMTDSRQPVQVLKNRFQALILLYLPGVMDEQLKAYTDKRHLVTQFTHEVAGQNLDRNDQQRSMSENLLRQEENDRLIEEYGIAKLAVEEALFTEMKKYIN